jgi:hypothetical protein
MNENNIESIVVVSLGGKDQKPIGIITERGIVRTIGKLNPVLLQNPMKTHEQAPYHTIA